MPEERKPFSEYSGGGFYLSFSRLLLLFKKWNRMRYVYVCTRLGWHESQEMTLNRCWLYTWQLLGLFMPEKETSRPQTRTCFSFIWPKPHRKLIEVTRENDNELVIQPLSFIFHLCAERQQRKRKDAVDISKEKENPFLGIVPWPIKVGLRLQ